MRTKLSAIGDTIEKEHVTLREVMKCTSLLMYASAVTGTNKAEFYWVMKFMRRRASEQALLDEAAAIWPSVQALWRCWAELELQAPPRIWHKSEQMGTATMYTDASLDGWGAICFRGDGSLAIRAGKWSEHDIRQATTNGNLNINVLEALAVCRAFESIEFSEAVHLKVDNTSVVHRLPKGFSKSFQLNLILGQLHQFNSRIIDITYVESAKNIADKLSRLFCRK